MEVYIKPETLDEAEPLKVKRPICVKLEPSNVAKIEPLFSDDDVSEATKAENDSDVRVKNEILLNNLCVNSSCSKKVVREAKNYSVVFLKNGPLLKKLCITASCSDEGGRKAENCSDEGLKNAPNFNHKAPSSEKGRKSKVCVKNERSYSLCDKASYTEEGRDAENGPYVLGKTEPSLNGNGVKEASSLERGNNEVEEELYKDHAIKKELVIGPERVEQVTSLNGHCVKEALGDSEVENQLYKDNVIKKKLVIGPELVQRTSFNSYRVKEALLLEGRSRNVSEELYQDHVIKEELVIGPEEVQQVTSGKTQQEPRATQCQNTSKDKMNLQLHKWTHAREITYKWQAQPRQRIKQPYQCSHCPFNTTDRKIFLSHEAMHLPHTKERPHKCNQCSYTTNRKDHLQSHQRMHKGEKAHKCSECGYSSDFKRCLITHLRKHSREKPFSCDKCSFTCSRKDNLKVHEKTHVDSKLHKCGECSFSSNYKKNLENHVKAHRGEKPFKCDQCDCAYTHKVSLIVHQRKHTGEKPFKCGQCNYASRQRSNVLTHEKSHSRDKSWIHEKDTQDSTTCLPASPSPSHPSPHECGLLAEGHRYSAVAGQPAESYVGSDDATEPRCYVTLI